ncbi:MAG: EexN family lipoprotein [Acidithiobacillus sp.]
MDALRHVVEGRFTHTCEDPDPHHKLFFVNLRYVRSLLISTVALGLAGCSIGGHGPHGGHNVSWYLHHQKAMRAQLAWCQNSAGRDKYRSCKNARTAQGKALGHNVKNGSSTHRVGKAV